MGITTIQDIKGSKPVRKLLAGGIVEVIEDGSCDEKIPRARIRAVKDNATGWVTLRGNQGSTYLEKVDASTVDIGSTSKSDKEVSKADKEAGKAEKAEKEASASA